MNERNEREWDTNPRRCQQNRNGVSVDYLKEEVAKHTQTHIQMIQAD